VIVLALGVLACLLLFIFLHLVRQIRHLDQHEQIASKLSHPHAPSPSGTAVRCAPDGETGSAAAPFEPEAPDLELLDVEVEIEEEGNENVVMGLR
jgi:hypothetical protein